MKNGSMISMLFLMLFAVSCSSGDSSDVQSHKISSINEKKYSGGILDSERSYAFTYENSILKNVVMGNTRIEFTFSGDKMISTTTYTSNVIQNTGVSAYTDNRLVSYTNVSSASVPQQKKEFDYSSEKLQQIRSYFYSADNWVYNRAFGYSFDNLLNVTHKTETNYYGSSDFDSKDSYEFDSFNNPFKNMNQYIRLLMEFKTIDIMSNNNIIKQYSYTTPSSTTPIWTYNYEIVYNSNNYPVSVKKYQVVNGVIGNLDSEMTIVYIP